VELSPPGDVRLCSTAARDLLHELFVKNWGSCSFLDGRIILLNKISGIDRRDQVILDGRHIATLWFDITSAEHRLDLEPDGAALLLPEAKRGVVVCHETQTNGHLKGKWLRPVQIASPARDMSEGDNVILRLGKLAGVGVVRRRDDGTRAIRVKGLTKADPALSEGRPSLEDVIAANEDHLKKIERTALEELGRYLSRNRLPVNVSFSGGKDSLAALCLCRKATSRPQVIFINTGLEFPETVSYVRDLCRAQKLKLHEIDAKSDFFEQVKIFGPPAKDFRWCCKTNKLGPVTSFLQRHYPRGCVTIEGRRIWESFNRSTIRAVERNPYVPGQTTLSPIRSWRALEVMLYIHRSRLQPNPLYDQDFERIGCWLCPASLQSEFARLRSTHPLLFSRWNSHLCSWARENGLDQRYVDWGFWRWRRHPPKMVEISRDHGIDLGTRADQRRGMDLRVTSGRSPCGLEHSIEAALTSPQNHPFSSVAAALPMAGEVKYAEDMGAAVVISGESRATVFASGHIMVTGPKGEAERMLEEIVELILRVQMCTGCRICEKNCSRGAISIRETVSIDAQKCIRCRKCAKGCIAADQAARALRQLTARSRSITKETPPSHRQKK